MTDRPIVIAHRGASGYLPEHTLEAKILAHAMAADYIEQDLALSRDDELVVIHDIYLETVTNVATVFSDRNREDGHFYVIDFDWTELLQLNVHERINPDTGRAVFPHRYPLDKTTFKLHRFEDELKIIQGLNRTTGNQVGIYPEIKKPAFHRSEGRDISKRVLGVLKDYGYTGKEDACYLQCFDPEELKRIRHKYDSRLKLIQLIGENSRKDADTDFNPLTTANGLKKISQYADGIGPALSHLYRGKDEDGHYNWTPITKLAHQRGLVVHSYTFRKETVPEGSDFIAFTANFLKQTRVDGFFTDFPDLGVKSVNLISPQNDA